MTFTPSGPIHLKRHAESYSVQDGQGRTLAYIYFRQDAAAASAAKVLTQPEAEDVAKMVARLMQHAASRGG